MSTNQSSGRVVTLTFNPAIDMTTAVDRLEPWRKLRCEPATVEAGGGGINVARAVCALGGMAVAVAAVGATARPVVEDQLRRDGVELRAVPIDGRTRENWSVTDRRSGQQFRFVQPGPRLSPSEWRHCITESLDAAGGAACFVISGSLPEGVPEAAIASLSSTLADKHVPVVVDTSGDALRAALGSPVALVKPSIDELVAVTGSALLPDIASRACAAGRLLARSACAALVVSMGVDGALLVRRGEPTVLFQAPRVQPISTSGAGDSMVAAMALSLARDQPLIDVVRYGVAAGSAAVLAPGTAPCHLDAVRALLPSVVVHELVSLVP